MLCINVPKLIAKINPKKWALWEWGLIQASFGLGMMLGMMSGQGTDILIGILAFIIFLVGTFFLSVGSILESSQAVEK